jgi:hypothetical protein
MTKTFGYEPNYKGLKVAGAEARSTRGASYEPTYKGLKRGHLTNLFVEFTG